MTSWSCLTEELDKWSIAGRRATFWLRDDDANRACPELDRFLETIGNIPLALAPVPAQIDDGLVARVRGVPSISVWQHGWAHRNWGGDATSEYPLSRNTSEVAAELAHGKAILDRLFGAQAKPIFVPPWSRFAEEFIPVLRKLRFTGISRASPRVAKKSGGISIVNAHVEMIEWTTTPSFDNDEVYLGQIVDHLSGRRTSRYDVYEPTGLIWHHHVQNDRSYEFLQKLIDSVAAHPAAIWIDPLASLQPPRLRTLALVGRRLARSAA